MRWLILFLLVCIVPIIVIIAYNQILVGDEHIYPVPESVDTPEPTTTIIPTPVSTGTFKILQTEYGNEKFQVYIRTIPRGTTLELKPNFTEKETGEHLIEEYGCVAGINGGFYQKTNIPLGLFITNGKQLGARIDSTLVTGFFWEYDTGERYISSQQPTSLDQVKYIIQSGPYMTVGSGPMKMATDEQARRSLLGIDSANVLYMISIADKENSFSGPYLGDIPQIFASDIIQKQVPLVTLLNLDGGSASYFYTRTVNDRVSLSEITAIGSLFCLK
jgi:hypothetical protein